MNYFREDIKNEQRRIQRLIDLGRPDQPLDDAGDGENQNPGSANRTLLNANRRGNSTYYYETHSEKGQSKKIYLGSAQSSRVQQLATARFQRETYQRLQKDARLLEQISQKYLDYDADAVLDALPRTYREAVRAGDAAGLLGAASVSGTRDVTGVSSAPNKAVARTVPKARAAGAANMTAGTTARAISADGFSIAPTDVTGNGFRQRYAELQAWAAADYERNTAPFPEAKILAKDGTRVRSKGECIFYNIFDEIRLPNRYDSVIEVTDSEGHRKFLSPDFLVQCFDRRLIAIEHLGWYNGLRYGIDFGEKCWWYLQGGFILGQNFFVTSDDAKGGTDSRAIMQVARQVERMVYGY